MVADLKDEGAAEDPHTEGGKTAKDRKLTDVNRRYFGICDFLRLVDVNAGGLQLRKGQGILHPRVSQSVARQCSEIGLL